MATSVKNGRHRSDWLSCPTILFMERNQTGELRPPNIPSRPNALATTNTARDSTRVVTDIFTDQPHPNVIACRDSHSTGNRIEELRQVERLLRTPTVPDVYINAINIQQNVAITLQEFQLRTPSSLNTHSPTSAFQLYNSSSTCVSQFLSLLRPLQLPTRQLYLEPMLLRAISMSLSTYVSIYSASLFQRLTRRF